jgi:hypothetical protein
MQCAVIIFWTTEKADLMRRDNAGVQTPTLITKYRPRGAEPQTLQLKTLLDDRYRKDPYLAQLFDFVVMATYVRHCARAMRSN